jgi:hypothetical protein
MLISELPSNLVLKKVSPKIWLPLLTILWGIVTMCLGFVQNYAGFVVVRAILGVTEGGLLPGIVSFTTLFIFISLNLYWGSSIGFILVQHVHTRRNGAQDWPFLYKCLSIRCFWRSACSRTLIHRYRRRLDWLALDLHR